MEKFYVEELVFKDKSKAYRVIDNSTTRIICTCRYEDDANMIIHALSEIANVKAN